MMDDLYLWGTAILVGLASLKLIPAKKLASANRRMRSRFSGITIAILYIIISILFFVSAYFLCMSLDAPAVLRNIILGVIIGLFIGFIPIVDKKNSGDDDKKND